MNTAATAAYNSVMQDGVELSSLRTILYHAWNIPDNYKQDFPIYYLLHWETSYFFSKLVNGTITRNNITYQVIYAGHSLDELTQSSTLRLSFRVPKNPTLQPTVLIKI